MDVMCPIVKLNTTLWYAFAGKGYLTVYPDKMDC